MTRLEPFAIGAAVELHDCAGEIILTTYVGMTWYYLIRWDTGARGWWNHERVTEMDPVSPGIMLDILREEEATR